MPRRIGLLWAVALSSLIGACTIEDISDEIRVVETVPRPQAASTPHRISREIGAGSEADSVDSGNFTSATIRVLNPEDADLFPFLRVSIFVRTSEGRFPLAEGTDFVDGERVRELDVQFTGDIKPFLTADDLTVEWDVFYKSSEVGSFPAGGIELETVIGVSIDVEIL